MTGSPFQPPSDAPPPDAPPSDAAPRKPPADIRTIGRRHKWASLIFLFVAVAAAGVVWLLNVPPNN